MWVERKFRWNLHILRHNVEAVLPLQMASSLKNQDERERSLKLNLDFCIWEIKVKFLHSPEDSTVHTYHVWVYRKRLMKAKFNYWDGCDDNPIFSSSLQSRKGPNPYRVFFVFFFFNLGIQTSISLQLCLKSEVKLFVEVVRDEKCYQKDYGYNEHTISVN